MCWLHLSACFVYCMELKSRDGTLLSFLPLYRGNDWTSEAIDDFESLTHTAQWKPLLAKVIKFKEIENTEIKAKSLACLTLVDTNSKEDINVGDELVKKGHAIL